MKTIYQTYTEELAPILQECENLQIVFAQPPPILTRTTTNHPIPATEQLGLTTEEVEEVLEDQREWMREEEQRHEEGVETQHPTETYHQQGEQNNDTDTRTAHPPREYTHSTAYDMVHDNDTQAAPSEHRDWLDDNAVHAEPNHGVIEPLVHKPIAMGNRCRNWSEDLNREMEFNLQGEYTARYSPTPSPIPWYPPHTPIPPLHTSTHSLQTPPHL